MCPSSFSFFSVSTLCVVGVVVVVVAVVLSQARPVARRLTSPGFTRCQAKVASNGVAASGEGLAKGRQTREAIPLGRNMALALVGWVAMLDEHLHAN